MTDETPTPPPPPTPEPKPPAVKAGKRGGTSEWSTPAQVTLPPPGPTRPARIGALRVAGRLAIAGLIAVIVHALADLVLTPMSLIDPADDSLSLAAGGLALVGLIFLVGTAAAFITWLYLAMDNLRTWQINGHGWTPGWAIGGWFIPLANLVIPGVVVNSAMRGSNTPANSNYADQTSYGLVWGWWLTFVFSNCVGNAIGRQDFSGADYGSAASANGVGTVLAIISAVLGILVVRRITGLQEQRQAVLDGFLKPGRDN